MIRALLLALAMTACPTSSAAQDMASSPSSVSIGLPAWLRPIPMGAILLLTTSKGKCSAVAVSPTVALTAAHCLPKGATRPRLTDQDGTNHPVVSYVIQTEADAAELTVDAKFTDFAQRDSAPLTIGQLVYISGYGCFGALDVRPAVYVGEDDAQQVVMNGLVCRGDSGGPVFNAAGQVVALVKATTEKHLPLGWATPIRQVTP